MFLVAKSIDGGLTLQRYPRGVVRICASLEAEAVATFTDTEARKEYLEVS